MSSDHRVAVVGATGYVGRLLSGHLAQRGHQVVAIGRDADRLPAGPGIEPRPADVADGDAIRTALTGVDVAYYLVHSLASDDLSARDRNLAQSLAEAAKQSGVGRLVYLGGLGDEDLSEHLSSRQEVGQVLRQHGPPLVELRAAVILGAGSISFEMLRYLTERLPAMVCPRWVDSRLQPLAQRDLLSYLEQAPGVEPGIYEIGSPDVTTYREMMDCYARVRGLRKRVIVKVPLLTPSLSARWVDLVTPVDKAVSHSLIGSLTNEVVVRHPAPTAAAFDVQPMTVAEGIRAALDDQAAAMPGQMFDLPEGLRHGIYALRSTEPIPEGSAEAVEADLARCGGDLRWYGSAWGWRLRIALGWLFGERLRIQRPERAEVGASADWWTIEELDRDRLVLGSVSWFFGDAWLAYLVADRADIVQVAAFRPKGVPGLLYWRFLRPIHGRVFRAMIHHRINRAEAQGRGYRPVELGIR